MFSWYYDHENIQYDVTWYVLWVRLTSCSPEFAGHSKEIIDVPLNTVCNKNAFLRQENLGGVKGRCDDLRRVHPSHGHHCYFWKRKHSFWLPPSFFFFFKAGHLVCQEKSTSFCQPTDDVPLLGVYLLSKRRYDNYSTSHVVMFYDTASYSVYYLILFIALAYSLSVCLFLFLVRCPY